MAAKKTPPPIPVAPDASPEVVVPVMPTEAPVVAPRVASGPPATPPPVTPEADRPNPYAAPAPYGAVPPYGAPVQGQQPPYGAPGQPSPYAINQTYDYATGNYVTTPVLPQGLSLASMITGIAGAFLSLFAFGFLPALTAVILGHIAQRHQPHARGLWLTGIITGYAGIAISLLWSLVTIVPLIFLLIAWVAAGSTGNY